MRSMRLSTRVAWRFCYLSAGMGMAHDESSRPTSLALHAGMLLACDHRRWKPFIAAPLCVLSSAADIASADWSASSNVNEYSIGSIRMVVNSRSPARNSDIWPTWSLRVYAWFWADPVLWSLSWCNMASCSMATACAVGTWHGCVRGDGRVGVELVAVGGFVVPEGSVARVGGRASVLLSDGGAWVSRSIT